MSTATNIDTHPAPRQRSARNDPAMRDGDSAHGNPYEPAADEVALDSDADIEHRTREDEVRGELTPRDAPAAGVVKSPPELPVAGYPRLTIPEVMEHANGLSTEELDRLIAFERGHRNRKTLLAKLRRLAERA